MYDLSMEQTEFLGVPVKEQIAYFKLSGSGGDLQRHIDYSRNHCDAGVSQEQLTKGFELYRDLLEYIQENTNSEKMCECIFP